jgi:hypothetical protein
MAQGQQGTNVPWGRHEVNVTRHHSLIGESKTILKNYSTPATPGTSLKKNGGEIIQESNYRSVVWKALYLTTKVAPELCNAFRELLTHLPSPAMNTGKSLEDLWDTWSIESGTG